MFSTMIDSSLIIRWHIAAVRHLTLAVGLLMFAAERVDCGRIGGNVTVTQHDTAELWCYTKLPNSPDWVMKNLNGDDYETIYSYENLQSEYRDKRKYNFAKGSGFHNLSIYDVNFDDAREYQCREDSGGGQRHSLYLHVNDYDECSRNDSCDPAAICTNTHGSFKCKCKDGYSGDGYKCHDINECLNSTLNTCDINANCTNTRGGHNCTCDRGFVGLGKNGTCHSFDRINYDTQLAYVGQSVSLSCRHDRPVIWLYIESNSSLPVFLFPVEDGLLIAGKNISENKILKCGNCGDYGIKLHNVQLDYVGWYMCIEEDGYGNVSSTYLNVTDTPTIREFPTAIVAAIAVSIISLIVIVIAILVFCFVKKGKREELAVGYFEGQGSRVDITRGNTIDRLFTKLMPTKRREVTALTLCGNRLYVALKPTNGSIDVYDTDLKKSGSIEVDGLGDNAYGLTSCSTRNFLYVSDSRSPGFVRRVKCEGNAVVNEGQPVETWTSLELDGEPRGISITSNALLVTCRFAQMPNKLIMYDISTDTPQPALWIDLPESVINPQHSILLDNGQFLVLHGFSKRWKWPDKSLHRVCVVKAGGSKLIAYDKLKNPQSIAVDINGLIFVADGDNDRIAVLDRELKFQGDMALKTNNGELRRPTSLCFDEQHARLYIGSKNSLMSVQMRTVTEIQSIRPKERTTLDIRGLTVLDDELFVRYSGDDDGITVYDSKTFKQKHTIPLPDLHGFSDMVSCTVNGSKYIYIAGDSSVIRLIHRPTADESQWPVDTAWEAQLPQPPPQPQLQQQEQRQQLPLPQPQPQPPPQPQLQQQQQQQQQRFELNSLSVNSNFNILVTFKEKDDVDVNSALKVYIYSSSECDQGKNLAKLLTVVQLPRSMPNPSHAVQLAEKYIVCHGGGAQRHRVCVMEVSDTTRICKSFGGNVGPGKYQLDVPIRVAAVTDFIFVADRRNRRLLLLSNTSESGLQRFWSDLSRRPFRRGDVFGTDRRDYLSYVKALSFSGDGSGDPVRLCIDKQPNVVHPDKYKLFVGQANGAIRVYSVCDRVDGSDDAQRPGSDAAGARCPETTPLMKPRGASSDE